MEDETKDYGYWFLVEQEAMKLADVRMKALPYKLERFGIRCARIACGLAMVFGALVLIGNTPNVSDTPFAQLTIDMLVSSVAGWAFGVGLVWWAFVAAFGSSPEKSEVAKRFAAEAEIAVKASRDRARMNT